jgi:hypothetical protein
MSQKCIYYLLNDCMIISGLVKFTGQFSFWYPP